MTTYSFTTPGMNSLTIPACSSVAITAAGGQGGNGVPGTTGSTAGNWWKGRFSNTVHYWHSLRTNTKNFRGWGRKRWSIYSWRSREEWNVVHPETVETEELAPMKLAAVVGRLHVLDVLEIYLLPLVAVAVVVAVVTINLLMVAMAPMEKILSRDKMAVLLCVVAVVVDLLLAPLREQQEQQVQVPIVSHQLRWEIARLYLVLR